MEMIHKKELNLSETMWDDSGKGDWQVNVDDVKEFIKLLKKGNEEGETIHFYQLDKLAGKELI